ncbi:MAG: pyridoxal-phosphate dependent enzyme [Planctomycetota bacterium]|nr:MAG: pyridoxal-phosphate dependent enzyme [Planctomycetota bacterium]
MPPSADGRREARRGEGVNDTTRPGVLGLIGESPLVPLARVGNGCAARLFAKLEFLHPSGSAKDRSALAMIEAAERSGQLAPGGTIIEASSGNTAIAAAMAGACKGYRVVCVTTDRQSQEKIRILKAFGAEVVVCPAAVRPEDPRSYLSVAWRLAEERADAFYLHQHANPAAVRAHEATARELWEQTGGALTHVFCGVGTGATACGIAAGLRAIDGADGVEVIGVQPAVSELLADSDPAAAHHLEGLGEESVSQLFDPGALAGILRVEDRDALLATRRLARAEGLLCGPSSGAVLAAALRYARERGLDESACCVCVLHDSGERYLSKVFSDEWMRANRFFEPAAARTAAELCGLKRAERDAIGGLITVSPHSLLLEVLELFRHHEVSQLPVLDASGVVGSVKEDRVVHLLVRDPEAKSRPVRDVMDPPFPIVEPTTPVEQISDLLRDSPAVLVDTAAGLDILTKADLVRAIARWAG